MRKSKPIEIKEYRPLTELEMKNVFGGSGESGDSGGKCKNPGAPCMITFSHKNPGAGSSAPLPPPLTGTCRTFFPNANAGVSGALKLTSGCNCEMDAPPYINDELYKASNNCESEL